MSFRAVSRKSASFSITRVAAKISPAAAPDFLRAASPKLANLRPTTPSAVCNSCHACAGSLTRASLTCARARTKRACPMPMPGEAEMPRNSFSLAGLAGGASVLADGFSMGFESSSPKLASASWRMAANASAASGPDALKIISSPFRALWSKMAFTLRASPAGFARVEFCKLTSALNGASACASRAAGLA